MIKGLNISMYRRFESLRVDGLNCVNLLVGENNSGKTTILEAVHLLASGGDPEVLLSSIRNRGEYLFGFDDNFDSRRPELDPGFLFHNREMSPGSQFEIASTNGQPDRLSCSIIPFPEGSDAAQSLLEMGDYGSLRSALVLESNYSGDPIVLPLSQAGGIHRTSILKHMRGFLADGEGQPIFVTSQSLGAASMASMWNAVALTEEEDEVIHALQIIEPDVERIAFLSSGGTRRPNATEGVVVKLRDSDMRMPLGSMGDGIRRMLALTLAVSKSRNSVLLVDEIDTGLHYSVMSSMWKMIIESAARNNTQVFATTHSQDCLTSLAWLCESEPHIASQVSLQRLHKGADSTVHYSAQELASVIQRRIEVR